MIRTRILRKLMLSHGISKKERSLPLKTSSIIVIGRRLFQYVPSMRRFTLRESAKNCSFHILSLLGYYVTKCPALSLQMRALHHDHYTRVGFYLTGQIFGSSFFLQHVLIWQLSRSFHSRLLHSKRRLFSFIFLLRRSVEVPKATDSSIVVQ